MGEHEQEIILQAAQFRLPFVSFRQFAGSLRHLPLEMLVLGAELAVKGPDPQMGAHPRRNLVRLKRLGHVIRRAHGKGRDLVLGLGERGDEDYRDLLEGPVGLQAPADLEPVHLGHFDVEQNQVGRIGLGGHERLLSAGGRTRLIAPRAEQSGQ